MIFLIVIIHHLEIIYWRAVAELEFRLLGGLHITRTDTRGIHFISNKVPALLAYLAVTRRPHTREKLAALLWGEQSESDAKNNLRQALTNLRKIDADSLEITRDSVVFDGDCFLDTAQFEQGIRSAALLEPEAASPFLTESIRLYQGDFMEGFSVRDAPDFEDWMLAERARLREFALQGLHHLTEIELGRANYLAALETTSRLLAFDPWREEAHRQRMVALASAGQRSAALAQYQTCRRTLEKELGVEPSAETTSLYEKIRDTENVFRHNLPAPTTSFIGRESELTEIALKLQTAKFRLITLVGQGGVGKSRLALQAALANTRLFQDGVWYVPLAAVRDIEGFYLAITSALKLDLSGGEQLCQYLRDKNILLVLDNMEHLINESVLNWIVDTLRGSPNVKLLTTSLVRLNLQAETWLEVQGLPFIENENTIPSPATRLFSERARQLEPNFNPEAKDMAAIARLCELVEGSPLALELAAAWVRGLPVPEIVKEVERNLDILTSAQLDLPQRHRSIRAVLEHFWRLLSPDEQIVFQKMAVFQNGFTREAFVEVTGADISFLSRFVDKYALHFNEDGRYRRHSLMAQYSTLRLQENTQLYAEIHERHALYFSKFVKRLEREFLGGQPQRAISPFVQELTNIRLAWNWAVEHRHIQSLIDMSDTFMQAFDFAGLYKDAYEMACRAEKALETLPEPVSRDAQIARARVMGLAGAFLFRLGKYDQSIAWCQKSRQTLKAFRPHIAYAHTLVFSGAAAFGLGDFEQVVALWKEAKEEYQAVHSKWGVMTANANLAEAMVTLDNLEAAKTYAMHGLALAREMNNLEMAGAALTSLASIALSEEEFDKASKLAEQALVCHQQVGHDAHIANALAVLAKIAFKQNNLDEARRMLEESIGILKRVGNHLYLEQRTKELAEVLAS